ncbi:hypothetical protein JIN77_14670 [Verrucomicrobiaceae bacterium R5-34]|uniref:Uncharacterized protein n=1 Tax=Oceaniferula flava TaxID=2800421 RepID=A0AAE2VC59_9BACT|nr:hypothetical protein [Oceaniferula flavus]MBK1831977.1 hypothetical protein [Verrucomicrobiaceae bacterium R5-34]MBK1855255.1 hypothetical protein [Oceaniferula flavus]MBM1136561.1 hypothetical protein [Oceaniferula flavus]
MNITQILLGSTAAMLLAALILSYSAMRDGEVEDGYRQTAKELMDENSRLQAELERLRGAAPTAAPTPAEKPDSMTAAELDALKKENKRLQEEKIAAEEKRKQAEAETLAMNERSVGQRDKEARRARLIANAMVMAQVTEVPEDNGVIPFVVINVKHTNVRVGTRLAIRRNTGIVGEVIVTRIDDEAQIADPLPNPVGKIDIKVGDELIVAPL